MRKSHCQAQTAGNVKKLRANFLSARGARRIVDRDHDRARASRISDRDSALASLRMRDQRSATSRATCARVVRSLASAESYFSKRERSRGRGCVSSAPKRRATRNAVGGERLIAMAGALVEARGFEECAAPRIGAGRCRASRIARSNSTSAAAIVSLRLQQAAVPIARDRIARLQRERAVQCRGCAGKSFCSSAASHGATGEMPRRACDLVPSELLFGRVALDVQGVDGRRVARRQLVGREGVLAWPMRSCASPSRR